MLQLNHDVVEWRHVDGEVVALDLRDSMYLGVNGAGAVLWRELEGGATREDLTTALIDTYSLDRADAERDVDAFLDMLRDRDLLVQ